ncbi:E3 ubiquitin-protein ligase PRT1 [Vitis vinifera]|uniref:E3 ubiquitin-protein ligase PRT1 n=1 Tax=Vitis vinifera TaxID=29760 RepID=A0A438CQW9_VITVI|nr:E3 ubiquitin-protein ligase PRT1 [Vitis vinifera]RVW68815.1 E3 ubiquitin-protein ligase PRT1 [Vitis vinifera]
MGFIVESFLMCLFVFWCRDLLYKPIVLACGHISCFWCVHYSMDGTHESHCPICRNPYSHFPTICQMLHFMLLKMYPVAYKRREKQTLGEARSDDRINDGERSFGLNDL